MEIRYLVPLATAWERARKDLFTPFDPLKWFVVGFAAWLAYLGNHGFGGLGWTAGGRGSSAAEAAENIEHSVTQFLKSPLGLALIGIAFLLGILLALVILWLNCRGKLVFFDNVMTGTAAIVVPWTRTRHEGNSLFLWQLGFMIVVLLALAALLGPFVLAVAFSEPKGPVGILFVMGMVGVVLLIAIPAWFVGVWLDCFVVPLMWRDRIGAIEAWRRFLPLLRAQLGHFVLFALLLLLLAIVLGTVTLFAGCLTCCLAWLLLAIPYLGTVIVLPIYYVYRAFGPEFLAQFGPEWRIMPTSS